MFSHKVPTDIWCPLCLNKVETTLHALWRCSTLKEIRLLSMLSRGGSKLDSAPFIEFVLDCWDRLQRVDSDVDEIFGWAESYIDDFRRSSASVGSGGSSSRVVPRWQAPKWGRKVYLSKNGQELTGQIAYRQYRKENGAGFRKSKKKTNSRKKKTKS
ncbi:hypothetical protein LWI29_000679 [Acer saccharum]|uniref:Reverse transcriptase zinc-binding domain-containing protein n=1 Tax=Acer saccharum TaxID=4024 RepID=A0AA39STK4_ACESA|nr:hypothetical protein LWI29_000679 [Acer saccharum]